MPRHIIRPSSRSQKNERFVKRLVQELKKPGGAPLPLILEEEIPATQSRHVHVIWDQFGKLTEEERIDVIVEAYRQAEGDSYAEQITVVSGLTPSEALALGFLPWTVEPKRKDSRSSVEEYEKASEEEEKHTILGHSATLHGLRYARKEDAEEAVRRLQYSLPNSAWRVSREEETDD